MRLVGAVFAVALVFFGAFLGYIVFNPEQAQFFISFGINPSDIAILLSKLVSGVFGTIVFLLSIIWIVFLFRAIVTKREQKRKKTVSTILALFFGVLLFSTITFWAFLVRQVGAADFVNPNGNVVLFDNDKLLSKKLESGAQIASFDNLVGPVSIRFDLRSNVRANSRTLRITRYQIDFDGDGQFDREGANPDSDTSIVYKYDKKQTYSPKLEYIGFDLVTRERKTLAVELPSIAVAGVVSVKPTREGRFSFDASDIESLGKVEWYLEGSQAPDSTSYKFFPKRALKNGELVCLMIVSPLKTDTACDRVFVAQTEDPKVASAKVNIVRSPENPLHYTFDLGKPEDIQVQHGGVAGYRWIVDGGRVVSEDATAEVDFESYGKHTIAVELTDDAGEISQISQEFVIQKPLEFQEGENRMGLLVIQTKTPNAMSGSVQYDGRKRTYSISQVPVGETLILDAKNVKTSDPAYRLEGVEWDADGDGKYETLGEQTQIELAREGRVVIAVRYKFVSKLKNDTQTMDETIQADVTQADLGAMLNFTQDSEYAPALVSADASASQVKDGKIAKFIFSFGENGDSDVEGDARQNHRYAFPGEYTLRLTVVRDDGKRATTEKKIIVKTPQKLLLVNSSVASGFVGKGIDFDTHGSVGQIASYAWDFGDGSTSVDPMPAHVYGAAGNYTVKLTATFDDGSVQSTSREVMVREF